MADSEEKQPIIIKKVKKYAGGHHGGAWKVAYADFVTAMMAFFLLLWLLNVTTDEMKSKLSAFFNDPTAPQVSASEGGAAGALAGRTNSPEGARAYDNNPLTAMQPPSPTRPKTGEGDDNKKANLKTAKDEELKKEFERRQKEKFDKKKKEIEQAIKSDPKLSKLSENVLIKVTPEGLEIQIVDQEGEAMFPSGSARMFGKTEEVIGLISSVIADMPNDLSVRGHTDATPYTSRKDYSNWELSADRANATRRVLQQSGYPEDKVKNVMGKGATEPFTPEDPTDARNRRITILLLNEDFVPTGDEEEEIDESVRDGAYTDDGSLFSPDDLPDPGYRPSQGDVVFP